MHKKFLLILTAICLLTFGNTLFNRFVGDDYYVLVDNTFYHSWSNLSKLFTSDYLSDGDVVSNLSGSNLNSGEISYRPVKSLTYFVDYAIWKSNPFGYHLTNLFIHLCNVFLVYAVIFLILGNPSAAFWTALLFCVHPIQAETVNAVSYRHGFLGTFFTLLSFLSYLKWRSGGRKPFGFAMWGSLFFYFLAVFSVETAVLFPVILVCFELLQTPGIFKMDVRRLAGVYSGFVLIATFYLIVYFKVFPNAAFQQARFFGADWLVHVFTILTIFGEYALGFVWPFAVGNLPPFYRPAPNFSDPVVLFGLFVFFFGALYFWGLSLRRDRRVFLFGLWFFLFSLPVSNLLPLTTPMAYRFMYLPSVGVFAVMVILTDRIPRLGLILKVGFLCACIFNTVLLNPAWKNGFVRALHMTRDYPWDPVGRMFLAQEYYEGGQMDQARKHLQESLSRGLREPRGIHLMGVLEMGNPEVSKKYFERNVRMYPNFALSYVGLGRYYLLDGQLERARPLLERAIALKPVYTAYGYLIQLYLMEGWKPAAEEVLYEALEKIHDEDQRRSLLNFFDPNLDAALPVDIGI